MIFSKLSLTKPASYAIIYSVEKLFGEILVLGRNGEPQDEIAFITPYATEKTLLSQLEKLPGTVISTLRILD